MKNLFKNRKLLFISLGILFLAFSAFSYVTISSKKEDSKEYLYQAGFKNIPSLKNSQFDKEKKFWIKKGANFLYYTEADSLMKLNNFILADAEYFKEEIPDSVMNVIHNKFESLKKDFLYYVYNNQEIFLSENDLGFFLKKEYSNSTRFCFLSSKIYDRLSEQGLSYFKEEGIPNSDNWEIETGKLNPQIQIIAHPSKFINTVIKDSATAIKLTKPVLPDPIAVVKHRKGFVVLAHW